MSAIRVAASSLGCALLLACFLAPPAHAHKPSDSYLRLTVSGGELHGQWDIALRDLDHAIGLDADDDGAITWTELRTREAEIKAYALARLRVSASGRACTLSPAALMVERHTDGAYAAISLSGQCEGDRSLSVDYRLFFDLDPQHRGLMQLAANDIRHTAIFSPEHAVQRFGPGTEAAKGEFLAFAKEGVWHIWIGIDHLLFLCALLLPAMLVRTAGGWVPVPAASRAFWSVLKIVTSFTAAHSITLSVAALGIVSLPSRWVESAIAASVFLAALNNLYPVVLRRLWLVAFAFGLIHGFGFASVLLDLGVSRDALLISLLGFNLGVELGQIAIVAVYFLLACALRSSVLYRRGVLAGGSAAIALVASAWMVERALDLKLV